MKKKPSTDGFFHLFSIACFDGEVFRLNQNFTPSAGIRKEKTV